MNPIIFLDPSSGPVGASVNITGAGFDPSSTITIEFDGTPVATSPSTVTNTPAGFFNATLNVPPSSNGDHTVKATQGGNSDSETFTVTETSSLLATSRSNVSSFGAPANQSNVTFVPTPSNQSNASVPAVTNSSFDSAESNGTITIQETGPSLNASPTLGTENSSTAPTVKQLNDTSVVASKDNTINNNPPTSTSTQSNDTSNGKKSSEKSISISQPKSKDQPTPTELIKDNTTHELASKCE